MLTIRSGRLPDLSVKITLTIPAGICKRMVAYLGNVSRTPHLLTIIINQVPSQGPAMKSQYFLKNLQ